MSMQVDINRLSERVERLAAFTDPAAPPYTRRAFTPVYLEARHWLAEQFRSLGAEVALDSAANLIARFEGTETLPPVMVGSHIDTVTGGGRFDGVAGVLTGLEVAQVLRESGECLRHPLEVVDFLSEEPSEFGVSCIGSQAMAGVLPSDALGRTGSSEETLAEAIRRMGGQPEDLGHGALREPQSVHAFVELHIEQGPVLEQEGCQIGIVTEIVAIRRYDVRLCGRADHAGTTPMRLRKDALAAAAEVIREVNRAARSRRYAPLVATVGKLAVRPSAANVVPEQVELTLDVRSPSQALTDRYGRRVLQRAAKKADRTGVSLEWDSVADSPPRRCAPAVQEAIAAASRRLGYRFRRISSGAGHDAAHLAAFAPTGMIFIPCRDGRSHTAEEWVEPDDLAAGAEALLETVRQLDR